MSDYEDSRFVAMGEAVEALATAWAELDQIRAQRKLAWIAVSDALTRSKSSFEDWYRLVNEQDAAEARVGIARKRMIALAQQRNADSALVR